MNDQNKSTTLEKAQKSLLKQAGVVWESMRTLRADYIEQTGDDELQNLPAWENLTFAEKWLFTTTAQARLSELDKLAVAVLGTIRPGMN